MPRRRADPSALEAALALAFEFTGTPHGASRWKEARRCPYAHHIRYVEGIRPKQQADYFAIGNLGHAILAYMALGVRNGFNAKVDHVIEAARERKLFEDDVLAEGERLLKAYFGKYGVANAGYGKAVDILEVEYFVSSKKLGDRYTGRVDCLLEMEKDGKSHLMVVDHKLWARMPQAATKAEEKELIRKLAVDAQFLGLAYCLREQENEIPSICLNVISKTKLPDFRRFVWLYSDEELDEWAKHHKLSLAQGVGRQTWKNYSECVPWAGNPCWAFEWCHGTNEERKKLYQVRR
jgi:hypothetical protein